MNFIYEIIAIIIISYIISAIICAICNIQIEKFLDEINMSKYHNKKKLLLINREFETDETKLFNKYITKIQVYITIFLFVIIFLLNNSYNIIKF